MLFHKKNVIVLLLAVIACSLGFALYVSWNREMPSAASDPLGPNDSKALANEKHRKSKESIPSMRTFGAVKEKNIFSPDRKEYLPEEEEGQFEEKDVEKDVEKVVKISSDRLELYVIVHMGENKKALVFAPGNDKKEKQWVALGDRLGSLQVVNILPDSVVLQEAGKKYEVKLHDQKRGQRGSSSAKSSTAKPQVVSSKKTSGDKRKPKPPSTSGNNAAESNVIHTPFGDIVRKK